MHRDQNGVTAAGFPQAVCVMEGHAAARTMIVLCDWVETRET